MNYIYIQYLYIVYMYIQNVQMHLHTHMCLHVYLSRIVNLVIALFAYICHCTLEILYFNQEKCPSNMIKHEHDKYFVHVCFGFIMSSLHTCAHIYIYIYICTCIAFGGGQCSNLL